MGQGGQDPSSGGIVLGKTVTAGRVSASRDGGIAQAKLWNTKELSTRRTDKISKSNFILILLAVSFLSDIILT
jgi:hypothetical protein